jgi:hypothetical protein
LSARGVSGDAGVRPHRRVIMEGRLNDTRLKYLVLALMLWWAFWVVWIVVRREHKAT